MPLRAARRVREAAAAGPCARPGSHRSHSRRPRADPLRGRPVLLVRFVVRDLFVAARGLLGGCPRPDSVQPVQLSRTRPADARHPLDRAEAARDGHALAVAVESGPAQAGAVGQRGIAASAALLQFLQQLGQFRRFLRSRIGRHRTPIVPIPHWAWDARPRPVPLGQNVAAEARSGVPLSHLPDSSCLGTRRRRRVTARTSTAAASMTVSTAPLRGSGERLPHMGDTCCASTSRPETWPVHVLLTALIRSGNPY